ncbi:mitochondrial outer membrane protein SLC25A46-like isoform X3 [Oratosquilla oratoria]|uniref:mitochondrial outer membrane protein SLC25A46-like isoform X3 n=1 Tax=Oratosquilla oratoria TaxID=337810 RepID=UPI003F777EF9
MKGYNMAGLDDYRFYSHLKEKESPFWQKNPYGSEEDIVDSTGPIRRPSEFPSKLQPSKMESSYEKAQVPPASDVPLEKYGEVSINLVSLCADNLLSHPFIVLRRQCQVNVQSRRYHLLPITLVPSVVQLHRCQGLTALWKGLGSVLTIRGVTMALEDCVSKFTPWPKEISPHSSLKMIGQHLMLKCCALALITPFYSASLVETVQSEIASERPGVLDVFKEGLTRLLSFTQPQTGRMLPVWLLVIPTVTHGIMQYIVGNAVSTLSSQFLLRIHRQDQKKQGAVSKDPWTLSETSFIRLQAAFVGHLVSDVLLYPLETVLNRLHMQGTRTIIDSLDVVYEVKPILTRYEGFWDCLGTTVREEGILGLYKGFGALCLQYALYGAVLKFAHVIIREVTLLLAPPKPKPKPQGGEQCPEPTDQDCETHAPVMMW